LKTILQGTDDGEPMITAAAILIPTLLLCVYYYRKTVRKEQQNRQVLAEAERSGMIEPPSLHPVIDPLLCGSCGSCVEVCPEGEVLGMIDGKATLIQPTKCIGHGACREVCPLEAITLVFGTATRGVDIPHVKPDFSTNVPGIYIAGELGGMGLIRNAIEQGGQVIGSIRKYPGIGKGGRHDVVIVGAGPAGFAASLAAMKHSLDFVTVEQETLGGTVAHYPRGKIVMTAPVDLPLVGKVRFQETTKEALLNFWTGVEKKTGVKIRYEERVESIAPDQDGFTVTTSRGRYRCRTVVLAIGRRGTPRKLAVPGEELDKVVYRLIDPEQYRGKSVLVVGGGDSALEAAVSLSREPDTEVTLSYRSTAFTRAKEKNRAAVLKAERDGRLSVLLESTVAKIGAEHVLIRQAGADRQIANDAVIVSAGGVLPSGFLRSVGIDVETRHGT
jgi:thioredoxin reductase/NAD-dependent dihydropyrimidine dehydrogenase PreA subunit